MSRFFRTGRGTVRPGGGRDCHRRAGTVAGVRQMTALERSVHRAQITKVSMARETTAQIGW